MQIYQIISLFIPLAGIAASYLILKKAVHWLMVLLVLFLLMPYIIAMLLLWGFPYNSMIVNVVRASNWLFFCVAYTGILTNWINQQPKKSNNDNPIMLLSPLMGAWAIAFVMELGVYLSSWIF